MTLSIDKTAPAFTFTSHHDHQIVNTPQVVIAGGSDDAITATVNGQTATIDTAAKTFTSPAITLTEGNNAIVVTGKDAADNSGTATITLNLDDIKPHVAITSPANNATVPDPSHVVISGTASDDQTAVAAFRSTATRPRSPRTAPGRSRSTSRRPVADRRDRDRD